MKAEDFKLDHKETDNGHEDYWFDVYGETREQLTGKYMEQSMVSVVGCVYSKDEDVVGIKRLFPFSQDVIISDDEELKQILKELTQ